MEKIYEGVGVSVFVLDGVLHEVTEADDITAEPTDENKRIFLDDAKNLEYEWEK